MQEAPDEPTLASPADDREWPRSPLTVADVDRAARAYARRLKREAPIAPAPVLAPPSAQLVLPTHGDPLFQDVDEMIDQIIPAMGGLGLRCMAGQRVTLTVVNRGDACDLSGCWFAFGARVLDAHECSN